MPTNTELAERGFFVSYYGCDDPRVVVARENGSLVLECRQYDWDHSNKDPEHLTMTMYGRTVPVPMFP